MLFENLTVDRIAIHDVYRRLDDKKAIPPTYGTALISLPQEAMDYFRDRVITAMGNQSQSMEMAISAPVKADAAVKLSADTLGCDDAAFLSISKTYADRLTEAQTRRDIPGGVLVVFDGNVGHPARRYVGIIKSETHQGFRHASTTQIQFLKDLFMGPQTKLYKIGIFVCTDPASSTFPDGWSAHVYDSQMSSANRDGAAHYFYGSFLGCELPTNAAQLTKKFYEQTREFINKIDVPEERKSDLLTGLYTYLKVDQSPTVEISSFAKSYLGDDGLKDAYTAFMNQKSFPGAAVLKDITDIGSKLRRRRLTFSRNVQLTAPSEAFEDLVEVRSIVPPGSPEGAPATWTQITIHDRIRGQE